MKQKTRSLIIVIAATGVSALTLFLIFWDKGQSITLLGMRIVIILLQLWVGILNLVMFFREKRKEKTTH
jgi:hypothetical protein